MGDLSELHEHNSSGNLRTSIYISGPSKEHSHAAAVSSSLINFQLNKIKKRRGNVTCMYVHPLIQYTKKSLNKKFPCMRTNNITMRCMIHICVKCTHSTC